MYNGVMRALQLFGLADVWGDTRIPLYVLNVTYPLVDAGPRRVLPRQARGADGGGGPAGFSRTGAARDPAQSRGADTAVSGKDVLPMAGEYTAQVLVDGIRRFLEAHAPALLRAARTPPGARRAACASRQCRR